MKDEARGRSRARKSGETTLRSSASDPRRVTLFRGLAALITTAALLSHSTTARCQDESIAEALFRDGRNAMKVGDMAKACAALSESERLDPSAGTLLNLAICEEQLGHLATAWSKYRAVEDTVPPSDPRAALAKHGREALDPKVPRLRLVGDSIDPAPTLKLDGTELRAPTVGTWIPVDPGVHRLALVRPDGSETGTDIRVNIAERLEVKLSEAFREEAAAERAEAGRPVPPFVPRTTSGQRSEKPHSRSRSLMPIYVSGGIAAAGFISAGVLATVALSQKQAVDAHCSSGFCDRQGLQTASNGSRLLHLADVGLAIGVAGACATGFLLWERAHQKIQVGATNRGAAFLYSADFR